MLAAGLAAGVALGFLAAIPAEAARKRGGIGAACGGRLGLTCRGNLYCDYKSSAICGRADALGTCQRKTQFCLKIYRPVCGCDGATYGNDCERRAAGVGKLADGACKSLTPEQPDQ